MTAALVQIAGGGVRTAPVRPLIRNPYLHIGPEKVYNPLTDRLLEAGMPAFDALWSILRGERTAADLKLEERLALSSGGWLIAEGEDLSKRFLLKYVSLEAHTVCNQSCYFCPVSVDPREAHFMPTELYQRILGELSAFKETIEAVFMISYNEPTADRRFVDQVGMIRAVGLPPATLTNGSGLTPVRVDQLLSIGGLRFLSINISTLDRERYKKDRGADHLGKVLKNLDYVKDKPLAEQMDIVVLGTGDEVHQKDFEDLSERFAGSRFEVKHFVVNDRAGYLTIGMTGPSAEKNLCGCDYVGSRPLQHLHITPHAKCILCCQDYDETHIVGDLNESSVIEVLTGEPMAQARRRVYGLEKAPRDFICRDCRYSLVR
ncbi:MAG: radical SAM protein [Acidobacteriota bacterium]